MRRIVQILPEDVVNTSCLNYIVFSVSDLTLDDSATREVKFFEILNSVHLVSHKMTISGT